MDAQQNYFNELAEKMMKGEMTASQASAEFKRREEGSLGCSIDYLFMVGALNYHIKWVAELQREIQALKASAEKKSTREDTDDDEEEDDDEEIACANCGDLGLKSNFNEGITKQGPKLYCKDCLW